MPDRRSTAAAAALTGLLVLGSAATAHAHGDTIRLTVTGVSAGHPVTTATWENDGDPVDETVAGTLSATSADGTTVGPWRFVPVPGKPGTYTTAEALPAGHWTITAQTAFPALGRTETQADVTAASLTGPSAAPAAPAAPAGTRAGPPAATHAAAGPATAHEDDSTDGKTSGTAVTIGVAAAAVAAAGTALWLLRRRARRNP
ncbi:hypothetical protein AB0K09_16835 [Streptomyces sp. NPDC049577]|uniref:hypothetical protein n=1 Tax=Streptomyces sp. NPDC049577 TaxID=3155153 RepID=UPI003423AC66